MILDDAMDDQGLVRHHLSFPERRPLTAADLGKERADRADREATGKEVHPLLGTPAYAMYEDANYVGNRFLMAMAWRQRALGQSDTAGREAVSRAYEASILPAQMGAALEPGYWPKPYGGVRDQSAVLFLRLTAACCCLANSAPVASSAVKTRWGSGTRKRASTRPTPPSLRSTPTQSHATSPPPPSGLRSNKGSAPLPGPVRLLWWLTLRSV